MSVPSIDRRTALVGIAAVAAVPARVAAPAISFLVVGDWGRDGAQHQRDVAVEMGRTAAARASKFVVSVGDNFYDNGVKSASNPQWQSSFEQVYTDPALQVPWYVALGNHDYRGNPQAQIDYAATSKRWRMPQRYYKVSGEALGTPLIDMFVIDTSPVVHQYRDKVESVIAHNVASQDVQKQLAWLDQALATSPARWKLVVGHHTLRSGGSGHGETPEMVELFRPIFQKRGVTAYLFGHDHDLQHIARDGLHYIGFGAGSEVRPVAAVEGTKFCASRSGFGAITVANGSIALEFRDYTGAGLYKATIAS